MAFPVLSKTPEHFFGTIAEKCRSTQGRAILLLERRVWTLENVGLGSNPSSETLASHFTRLDLDSSHLYKGDPSSSNGLAKL